MVNKVYLSNTEYIALQGIIKNVCLKVYSISLNWLKPFCFTSLSLYGSCFPLCQMHPELQQCLQTPVICSWFQRVLCCSAIFTNIHDGSYDCWWFNSALFVLCNWPIGWLFYNGQMLLLLRLARIQSPPALRTVHWPTVTQSADRKPLMLMRMKELAARELQLSKMELSIHYCGK